jgi:hypothetical protein
MSVQHIFTHGKEDIQYGVVVGDQKFERYVSGYPACKTCGQHPAFEFNSKKPDKIVVITCEHINEREVEK